MRIKNLEGTLVTRARDAGRAIDNQWIHENETKEIDYIGLEPSISVGQITSKYGLNKQQQKRTAADNQLDELLAELDSMIAESEQTLVNDETHHK